MEARNRHLREWFGRIESGQLRLPRFQRLGEAWSHTEVTALLNAVLRELPAGAALVLDVGDEATHTVPFDELNVGGYEAIDSADGRADKVKADYARFLEVRASQVEKAIHTLCEGRDWSGLNT